MRNAESQKLLEQACRLIPGGVNSPVRAFKSVGGEPLFVREARGSRIVDADGNEFIDYVCSWGPLILGHAPDVVCRALEAALAKGTTYGAPTRSEVELAELVVEMVPSVEMVRFVSSGSEATASAIRLARGVTRRDKVIKCSGCYHGSVDSLLVKAGSGIATFGIPDTGGVPAAVAAETVVVEYNDLAGLEAAFDRFSNQVAAFIVEPVAGNMGLVLPRDGYLRGARELTAHHGALLVFDEVISGFRVGTGGAQQLYGVQPDLTCLGKIIGGGLPVGAYGGRRELMEQLAPLGPVYQAGTLSGNPLAMAAGSATLREIRNRGASLYRQLDEAGARLEHGMTQAFADAGIPVRFHRLGSLFTAFFTAGEVTDFPSAAASDTARFGRFFRGMLDQGIYLAPSQFECGFISAAHSFDDIDRTVAAARIAIGQL